MPKEKIVKKAEILREDKLIIKFKGKKYDGSVSDLATTLLDYKNELLTFDRIKDILEEKGSEVDKLGRKLRSEASSGRMFIIEADKETVYLMNPSYSGEKKEESEIPRIDGRTLRISEDISERIVDQLTGIFPSEEVTTKIVEVPSMNIFSEAIVERTIDELLRDIVGESEEEFDHKGFGYKDFKYKLISILETFDNVLSVSPNGFANIPKIKKIMDIEDIPTHRIRDWLNEVVEDGIIKKIGVSYQLVEIPEDYKSKTKSSKKRGRDISHEFEKLKLAITSEVFLERIDSEYSEKRLGKDDIRELTGISVSGPTLSKYLKLLEKEKLVTSKKIGRSTHIEIVGHEPTIREESTIETLVEERDVSKVDKKKKSKRYLKFCDILKSEKFLERVRETDPDCMLSGYNIHSLSGVDASYQTVIQWLRDAQEDGIVRRFGGGRGSRVRFLMIPALSEEEVKGLEEKLQDLYPEEKETKRVIRLDLPLYPEKEIERVIDLSELKIKKYSDLDSFDRYLTNLMKMNIGFTEEQMPFVKYITEGIRKRGVSELAASLIENMITGISTKSESEIESEILEQKSLMLGDYPYLLEHAKGCVHKFDKKYLKRLGQISAREIGIEDEFMNAMKSCKFEYRTQCSYPEDVIINLDESDLSAHLDVELENTAEVEFNGWKGNLCEIEYDDMIRSIESHFKSSDPFSKLLGVGKIPYPGVTENVFWPCDEVEFMGKSVLYQFVRTPGLESYIFVAGIGEKGNCEKDGSQSTNNDPPIVKPVPPILYENVSRLVIDETFPDTFANALDYRASPKISSDVAREMRFRGVLFSK